MRTFFFLAIILIQTNVLAQEAWDLQKCITYAVENNIQIKQAELQVSSSKETLKHAKMGQLPEIGASFSDRYQFGRSIDPFTNEFTEESVRSLNLSIDGSITLFNGFRQTNMIHENRYRLKADLEGVEEIKNSIAMNVVTAYLQILFDTEIAEVTKKQLETTNSQLVQTKIMVESGKLTKGNLLEIQAQVKTETMDVVNAQNNLKESYLNLAQLLELDSATNFKVEVPAVPEPNESMLAGSVTSINENSQNLPRVKKQQFNVKRIEETIKVSKGALSPKIYLSASYGTGFSSTNYKNALDYDNPVAIGVVEGTSQPVIQPGVRQTHYHYGDQFYDNRSLAIMVGAKIPIFSKYANRNRISQEKINLENSKHQLSLTKKQLYYDIQKSFNVAESALAKYYATKEAVLAQEEAFKYVQQKFTLGLVSSLDYKQAKNQLANSKSELIKAKFEYIFRVNILKFYQGEAFNL